MIQDFARALLREIDEELRISTETVGRGSCEDFATYKYLTGRLQGLRTARDAITTLAQKAEEDE